MPSETIGQFAAEYFTLNSISAPRRKQVLATLAAFEAFAERPLTEATDTHLRAWLAALMESGLQASTVTWRLKMVKPFYRWAWQARLVSADEYLRIRGVKPPRGYRKGPRPYSTKELVQLWTDLDARWPYTTDLILKRWRNGTSPWRSVRKHGMRLQLDAILELALVCGLRRIEIYRLSIDDCHWDNKYIVVHGKRVDHNDKVREVPYPDSTREAIQKWVRFRALVVDEPGKPLWLSVTGPDPASPMNFTRLAHILQVSLGPYELHRLRHTCGTFRLRAGMELERLREFLGHARIEQTLEYAKLVRSDVHKSAERTDAEFQRAIRRVP